jgi:hypothetical protein
MHKYKGIFNYYQQPITLFTQAKCKNNAWNNFCYQLAKRLKVSVRSVKYYFDGSVDNYKITLFKQGE